jgi:hypothetical protein
MDKIKCNRCNMCNKKVGLLFFECKCHGKFCALHRYSEEHNCSYDFRTEEINKLIKDNPKIIPLKITTI